MAGECEMWGKIRDEEYSWLKIDSDKKKILNHLINIYSNFNELLDSVKYLNKKVERVKQLKNLPDESE